jgi:DNA (cytosine-5)-methyltransferase 1
MPTFYEFFAGGGMARAGLGSGCASREQVWTCLFANDNDPKKVAAYRRNWGDREIRGSDVSLLTLDDLPGVADLAWASFPCQDLSLAGMGAGLKGQRSGAFWPFWRLIEQLGAAGRGPRVVVLENVCGALTSHGGRDFQSLMQALTSAGYRCGAVVADAVLFLPHSRPRLFVIGVRADVEIVSSLVAGEPREPFHTLALKAACEALPAAARASWVWWKLPPPALRRQRLADIIEEAPAGVAWHTHQETGRLLSLMSPVHLAKVDKAKRMKRLMVGCLYKRTRPDESGVRSQRAEVRFDDIAGCLRTPNGGSSRQTILVVNGNSVKSRLLSARETARLMGLPDTYLLPENYNEAYHLTGDGVAVPVVRHLAQHLIEPLIRNAAVAVHSAA